MFAEDNRNEEGYVEISPDFKVSWKVNRGWDVIRINWAEDGRVLAYVKAKVRSWVGVFEVIRMGWDVNTEDGGGEAVIGRKKDIGMVIPFSDGVPDVLRLSR